MRDERLYVKQVSYWTAENTELLKSLMREPGIEYIEVVKRYHELKPNETTDMAILGKIRQLSIRNGQINDGVFSPDMTLADVEKVFGIKCFALRRYINLNKVPFKLDEKGYTIDITVADLLKDCQKSNRQIDWELFQTELKEIEPCLSY